MFMKRWSRENLEVLGVGHLVSESWLTVWFSIIAILITISLYNSDMTLYFLVHSKYKHHHLLQIEPSVIFIIRIYNVSEILMTIKQKCWGGRSHSPPNCFSVNPPIWVSKLLIQQMIFLWHLVGRKSSAVPTKPVDSPSFPLVTASPSKIPSQTLSKPPVSYSYFPSL
jgi:hypothetical protein